jgi:O-antigen/teichoic acid export membrane protein
VPITQPTTPHQVSPVRSVARLLIRPPRWALAVTDQGVVALFNLFMSVAVVRVAGVTSLGRFALVSAAVLMCMTVVRILVSDPWLASRTAGRSPEPELRSLVLLGALASGLVVTGVVALTCGGEAAWWISCLVAPAVAVQDFVRYAAFRDERPGSALASDTAVMVVGCATFAVWAVAGTAGVATILVGWLLGLLAGVAVSGSGVVGPVAGSGVWSWWRRICRSLALNLAFDGAAYLVGVTGSLYLLAYVSTQEAVGTVRIAQTLFSPAGLMITGLNMWLVPHLASREPAGARRSRRRIAVPLAGATALVIVVALVLGPWFVRLVFGVDDPPGPAALLLAGLSPLALAVAAPWVASARVLGTFAPLARARAVAAVVTCGGLLLVAGLRGVSGYLGLLALQNVLIAATAILVVGRAGRGDISDQDAPVASGRIASGAAAGD